MNIKLVVVGKTDIDYIKTGVEEYLRRLKHYVNFELVCLPALKEQRNASPDHVKERESVTLLKQMAQADHVVLLDEHGDERSSVDFAQYLQQQMNRGTRTLMFVVGGAFGFDKSVYDASHDKLSLSQMTFNHQMVRLFFVEQLYRAFTILKGEKYHNA